MILSAEIVLAVIMLAQLYVFLCDGLDHVKAIREFPQDAYVLGVFDYYEADEVLTKVAENPSIRQAGTVTVATCTVNGHDCRFAAYPEAILSHYHPSLRQGSWLPVPVSCQATAIPCVTSGFSGERVGDQIQVSLYGESFPATVVGILAQPTQVLYPIGSASKNLFSIDLITTQEDCILVPQDCLKPLCARIQESQEGFGNTIFLFADGDDSALASLQKYGELTDMQALTAIFRHDSREMILAGTLFAAVFLLLATTCILSNYLTESERSLRLYTCYYLLGMKWHGCVIIELTKVSVLSCFTFLLCLLAGRQGLLMLDWMTPFRRILFFVLTAVFIISLLGGIGAVSFHKLYRQDLSAALKEIHQGE